MGFIESDHPRGHASNAGSFSDKVNSAPEGGLGRYVNATPVECDTELADLWQKQLVPLASRFHVEDRVGRHEREVAYRAQYGSQNHKFAIMTERDLAQAADEIKKYTEQIDALQSKMDPIEAEFERRGGWTRAFLVMNSNGHVHASRTCATCFPTTQYGWLTEYSGHDEAEIVGLAGDMACTVCYPSAPVADPRFPRPSRLATPEQKKARDEREAAQVAREAKRLATGIWNPDGTELRAASARWAGAVIKTERTAELTAVDYLVNGMWDAERERDVSEANLQDWDREARETFDRIIPALASKRGLSVDGVRKSLEDKAAAKFAKQLRG